MSTNYDPRPGAQNAGRTFKILLPGFGKNRHGENR
jgi:hypothetical protein